MKIPEIAVVGSLNMDYLFTAGRLPALGETVMGKTFGVSPGGKGANQAVQAVRLGARVRMVGRVGRDTAGDLLLDTLSLAGVGTEFVSRDENEPTAAVCIRVDANGQNDIIITAGANGNCSPAEVDAAEEMIKRADVLLLQNEIPAETADYAVSMADKYGVPVFYNPAPARPVGPDTMRNITWFAPNETEASYYTGITVQNDEEAPACAQKLLDKGPGNVLITLGARGAVLCNRTQTLFVPAYPVPVKDTTAAGDAFCAAFAVAAASGETPGAAMRLACAAGAYAAMHEGAIASLGTMQQIRELMCCNNNVSTL